MTASEKNGENKINNDDLASEGDANSKIYELGYLLLSSAKEEEIPINYGNLKELVISEGGGIISDEMPKMINLAYPMQKVIGNVRKKFNTAYFGWIKFRMEAGKVIELKKRLDLDPNFIRFLILKTVRENTIAAKRYVRRDTYRRPKSKTGENEAITPINKEEIDKEIDALVAV